MLSDSLATEVITYLGVEAVAPGVDFLDELLAAYTRRVPWESVFRIARRANAERLQDCPRWPDTFWREAIDKGGGGTCFESNYAFLSLLSWLGFDGYLTINNMGNSIGCHTAIILWIDGEKWLADVGLPIYVALPIHEAKLTQRKSFQHTYRIVPVGLNRFRILRDRHPKEECFVLVDEAVGDDAYRQATTEDYAESGFFLDRLIITKVVGDVPWRFNGSEEPLHLESFAGGKRTDHPIERSVVGRLATHFAMDASVLRRAFVALGQDVS